MIIQQTFIMPVHKLLNIASDFHSFAIFVIFNTTAYYSEFEKMLMVRSHGTFRMCASDTVIQRKNKMQVPAIVIFLHCITHENESKSGIWHGGLSHENISES
jgi:hypothetical protein